MGILYIIATPIGNLGDISFRAIETIKILDLLLCEDTRVTGRLLERYGLSVSLMSYREQVHQRKLADIAERLNQGQTIGLVSDAGTPGISDPGSWLIRDLLKQVPEIQVVPVPGPSAAVAALSIAGFPTERFVFYGFPPHKKGRNVFFREVGGQPLTAVFYESPHRIEKALAQLAETCPERQVCLGRELTKLHESVYRGRPAEVLAALTADVVKGEFVVVLDADKSKRSNQL